MPEKLTTLVRSTMGNASSRARSTREDVRKRRVRDSRRQSQDVEMDEMSPEIIRSDEDDEDLFILRELISTNPEMFILNNLVMSVQFFRNYDEEIEELKEKLVSSREAKLNAILLPHKRVLLPDVLQEHVAKNVKFTSTRQTLLPTAEPLRPIRTYVVHENVEISEERNPPEYSTTNDTGIIYRLGLRESEHEGYVYLERLDVTSPKKNLTWAEVEIRSSDDGKSAQYSDGESIYGSEASLIACGKSRLNSSKPLANQDAYENTRFVYQNHEKLYDHKMENYHDASYECASSSNVESEAEKARRLPTKKSKHSSDQTKLNESCSSGSSSGYATYCVTSDSDASVGTQAQASSTSKDSNLSVLESTCEIPESCFIKVTYNSNGEMYDPVREGHHQILSTKQRRIKDEQLRYNYNVTYINSFEFSQYFQDVFNDGVGDAMKFDESTVTTATRHGASLFCERVFYTPARYTVVEPHEVIPSFWSPWPKCALEWIVRSRTHWPSYDVINKIQEFGCYIVPEGFKSRDGSNGKRDIEWSLNFPAADRYLETCMTPTQVQVYIIALMIHKTFIRPVDSPLGLDTSHIRNRFFWMIEENESSPEWPQYRVGECLVELLDEIYRNIRKHEPTMYDYFIRSRNLFKNIRREYLLHSQKQMKRIVNNPVMYVFHAMENIRYNQDFFPRLDYKELLSILRAGPFEVVNPILAGLGGKPEDNASTSGESKIYESTYDKGRFWQEAKTNRGAYSTYKRKQASSSSFITPYRAHDSIIEITERCGELSPARLAALLNFFVRHFVKMAERCHQLGSLRQRNVYLDHSKRLVILLSEQPGHGEDAANFQEQIKSIETRTSVTARSKSKSSAPEIPKRNADPPLFTRSLNERFGHFPPVHGDADVSEIYDSDFLLRGRKVSASSETAQSFVVETTVQVAEPLYEGKGAVYTIDETAEIHGDGKKTNMDLLQGLVCRDSEMTHV